MYLFDLQAKLRRLNPGLYVRSDVRVQVQPGIYSTALHLNVNRRKVRGVAQGDIALLGSEGAKRLQEHYTGQIDLYLGGVPLDWVPEFDEIDPKTALTIRKGWRSIVLNLVKQNVCSMDRARKYFGSSLGETRYDKFTYEDKVREVRNALK